MLYSSELKVRFNFVVKGGQEHYLLPWRDSTLIMGCSCLPLNIVLLISDLKQLRKCYYMHTHNTVFSLVKYWFLL